MKLKMGKTAGWALIAIGHVAGVALVALIVAIMIMPIDHAREVFARLQEVPALWSESSFPMLLHIGLSICIWAMGCILFQLARLRFGAERKKAPIRLSRGSVMTETLVIMPIFFLLTFGMAQLAINNIAGILANVAAYEAARAAWIWQPEEDASTKRMGITSGIAVEKCRIAVALVMTPVAPGEFFSDPRLPTYASKMRVVALGAHVPFGGIISSTFPQLADLLAGAASLSPYVAVRKWQSINTALDNASFARRTVMKFTHAFHASGCQIQADHSVKMTYMLQIAMPMMGPVMGEKHAPSTSPSEFINSGFGDLDGVGGRWGYFATYERTFGFKKQVNVPNAAKPQNDLLNWSKPDEGSFDPGSLVGG